MKVNLIGLDDMDFKTRDGSEINGVKLHYSYPSDKTYGHKAENKFISRNVFESFGLTVDDVVSKIGEVIDVEFDNSKYSHVVGMSI